MSKHETPMTEAFWETYANGAFLPEYCLVPKAPGCGRRMVDAIILPDEPHHRAKAMDYPSLAGRKVIVVQTKRGRMGMYLMGQAVFSAQLALACGAAPPVRSVLLCNFAVKPFPEVEVWTSDPQNPQACALMRAE
jgi:hypothetical protein